MEIGTSKFDNLLAGDADVGTRSVIIAAAQTLLRGAVLGLKTIVAAIARVASVTLSGTTAVGGAAVTLTVGTVTYIYTTVTGDTPTVVAAALKALVNADPTRAVNATNTAGKLILTFIVPGVNTATVSVVSADANITAAASVNDTAGADMIEGDGVLVDSTHSDGSQVAKVILLEDITTGASERKPAPCATSGEFNSLALTVGGTDTLAQHLDTLGRLSGNNRVTIKTNQAAVN